MGRDVEHDRDPDDWFAEPDTSGLLPRGPTVAASDAVSRADDAAAEDWLGEADTNTRAGADSVSTATKIAFAAVALAVLVVGGLLVGGVFESGGSPSTAPTAPRVTTTRPATTATRTAPAPTPTVAVPTEPLTPGDEGSGVTTLQNALARAGYPVGTVDGIYGEATKSAVTQFQADENLTEDGIAGAQTLAALNAKLNGG
jgi:hypothetical protein